MLKKYFLDSVLVCFLLAAVFTIACTAQVDVEEPEYTVDDFDILFEGDLSSDAENLEQVCSVYNTETGDVISTVTKEGMYGECSITNTYGNKIFFDSPPSGIGGYYLFNPGFHSTHYVDVVTGEEGELGMYVVGYSEDGRYAFQKSGVDGDKKLLVIDLETFGEEEYDVPDEYGQYGDVYLHEDAETLVYAAAIGDPADEKLSIIVAEPDGEVNAVIELSEEWYSIVGLEGDTILLENDGESCSIDLDGSNSSC